MRNLTVGEILLLATVLLFSKKKSESPYFRRSPISEVSVESEPMKVLHYSQ